MNIYIKAYNMSYKPMNIKTYINIGDDESPNYKPLLIEVHRMESENGKAIYTASLSLENGYTYHVDYLEQLRDGVHVHYMTPINFLKREKVYPYNRLDDLSTRIVTVLKRWVSDYFERYYKIAVKNEKRKVVKHF